MESNSRISDLLFFKWKGDLSGSELSELNSWGDESPENKELLESFSNPADVTKAALEQKTTLDKIWDKLVIEAPELKQRSMFSWRISVAAAVVIIIASYLVFNSISSNKGKDNPIVKTETPILPVNGNAILSLDDGRQIVLDSTGLGILAKQGETEIIKRKDGEIIYQPEEGNVVVFNTLQTAKGKKFEVVLPDGSRVTLNALSQLKYPTAFVGDTRKVILLEGEAFFQITKDKSKPFYVEVDGTNVKVVGTAFNIKAYKNEKKVKTTLFEGGIEVKKDTVKFNLQPGQELVYDSTTKRYKLINPNLEEAAAWRHGFFKFKDASIEEVMRDIERYYDIDVTYNGKVTQKFNGDIPSDLPISTVFKILEATGGVHFVISGRGNNYFTIEALRVKLAEPLLFKANEITLFF